MGGGFCRHGQVSLLKKPFTNRQVLVSLIKAVVTNTESLLIRSYYWVNFSFKCAKRALISVYTPWSHTSALLFAPCGWQHSKGNLWTSHSSDANMRNTWSSQAAHFPSCCVLHPSYTFRQERYKVTKWQALCFDHTLEEKMAWIAQEFKASSEFNGIFPGPLSTSTQQNHPVALSRWCRDHLWME